MKFRLKIFILFLFGCFILFGNNQNFFDVKKSYSLNDSYSYNISFNEKTFIFKDSDFNLSLTKIQRENYHNLQTLQTLKNLNFTDEEILSYLFPEINIIFSRLSKNFDIAEISDSVLVKENKCELEYIEGVNGKCVNKQKFYKDCLNQIENNKKRIDIIIEIIDYKKQESAKKLFCEKGCFSTSFSTSSDERKNNIALALKSFDGLVVEDGEIFSFNNITGKRTIEAGYKEAKIISQGTFVTGVGGGVCQVSTTLFNACLLAGLDIIESTSHSLPVSYVEPSFDAMVSFGSSDLKVRNNSGGKIIITTSNENDICKIKIFGLKNKYKITRQSEKVSLISADKDIIETDYKKYGDYELEIGEEKRISYAKDGFVSRGYLSYYDESGRFVERKQIRENKYNPTKGIILRREN